MLIFCLSFLKSISGLCHARQSSLVHHIVRQERRKRREVKSEMKYGREKIFAQDVPPYMLDYKPERKL